MLSSAGPTTPPSAFYQMSFCPCSGPCNANPVFVRAPSYGWAADGAWHSLTIPVADFVAAGLDATQVAVPFVLSGGAGMGGEKLLVDDVYFTAD